MITLDDFGNKKNVWLWNNILLIAIRLKCFYMCDIPPGHQAEHIIYSLAHNKKKALYAQPDCENWIL